MAPPVKRQKRLMVPSSKDETADNRPTRKPLATWAEAKAPHTVQVEHAAQSKNVGEERTLRPISLFFRTRPQAQQPIIRKSAEAEASKAEGYEDLDVEDSSIEDLDAPGVIITKSILSNRKKRRPPAYDDVASAKRSSQQGGSRRFKIPEHASSTGITPGFSGAARSQSITTDHRPWAEKYSPKDLEELMVHKRKISGVRNWLEDALRGHSHKRLLILKGPSGAGKTATVSMLAKAMSLDVSEWKNPVGTEFSSEAYSSMSSHFEDFLYRSGKFNRLALVDIDANALARSSRTGDVLKEDSKESIILMEEFPNTSLSTSTALRSFRSSILQYLALNTPSVGNFPSQKQGGHPRITPLVMIITETRLATTTTASDSFTAHRLLGPDILSHPCVSTIEFNPVASTYLSKALDLVIQKEARQSGRRRVPGPDVLKKLGEVGDIRSAVGSLEFLCLRGEDGDDWGGTVASRLKKGANISSMLTKLEKNSLEVITQRESTMGLFHAVGKVIYNKRDDMASGNAASEPLTQPPSHLSRHARPRVTQVSPDQLINETGADIETFIAALHENFVLSCSGVSFTDNLDACLELLSDSDILDVSGGGKFGSAGGYGNRSFEGAPCDVLKQDEICFHIAVRGLLFTLPDPVQRRTHPISGGGGGNNDTCRIFYPTSARLSRQKEEIDGLVSQLTDKLQAGITKAIGRHGWQSTNWPSSQEAQISNVKTEQRSRPDQNSLEIYRTSLGCNRKEFILERLPYVSKIEQHNADSTLLDQVERITQFHPTTPPINNAEEEEDDVKEGTPVSDRVIDSPAERNLSIPAPQQGSGQGRKRAGIPMISAEDELGQLYLSEDDIEDD